MYYHMTIKSSNDKTGAIPVTSTSAESCPDACPLKGAGCYGDNFPLSLHWQKVTDGDTRAITLTQLCTVIKSLPDNQLWRHNQVGDLPGQGNRINVRQLAQLVKANQGKRGFTYTHKPPTKTNLKAIRQANQDGFTINLSANSIDHADTLMEYALPVVTIVDSAYARKSKGKVWLETRAEWKTRIAPLDFGTKNKIVLCPATNQDTDCAHCGLCQHFRRDYMVAFPGHGGGTKKVNLIAKG